MRLYVAGEDDILSGKVTDIYFLRTKKIIESKGLSDVRVRMEVHSGSLPRGYSWAVYAGVEEALKILSTRELTVYSLPEGTLISGEQPVMIIEGRYYDICELETPLLGVLRHSTSVATGAARIKRLAMDKVVLYFGLRGAHPAIAPMLDRSAFIGGVDGVSGAFSEEVVGVKPKGTMPHALIIIFEDQVKAWKAFDEVIEPGVPRIALIDTFNDERVEALMAVEALGNRLYGVRFDTPKSRRGDLRKIIEEVRWTLKLHGYGNIKVFASGGIDEKAVTLLKDVVDGFGVGTLITYPRPIDMSLDIVELFKGGKWVPITKRGKLPAAKMVYRCDVLDYEVVPWGWSPVRCREPIMVKWLEGGKLTRELPKPKDIRNYVLQQLQRAPPPTT
ncbi:MAG: nicotinate phosphoribosyltransferase [Desulfurococcales archaeon ex4484_204]|nr:MAG: nicotinate phosphoribosyltransferase [Desulfurococcales archaeon ex4484_204]